MFYNCNSPERIDLRIYNTQLGERISEVVMVVHQQLFQVVSPEVCGGGDEEEVGEVVAGAGPLVHRHVQQAHAQRGTSAWVMSAILDTKCI